MIPLSLRAIKGEGEGKTEGNTCARAQVLPSSLVLGGWRGKPSLHCLPPPGMDSRLLGNDGMGEGGGRVSIRFGVGSCMFGRGRRWKGRDSSAWQRRLRQPTCGSPTPFGMGRGQCGVTRPPVVVDHTGVWERRPEAVLSETEFTDGDDPGVARGHNGPVPPVAGGLGSPTW